MEQRVYQTKLTPEQLGKHLVDHFNAERRTEAQLLGEGNSVLVQVREGRDDERMRNALTVGITSDAPVSGGEAPGVTMAADGMPETAPATPEAASGPAGLTVTLGEQEWFTPTAGTVTGTIGVLIGALFTPWALFGLIWPASQMLGKLFRPNEVWSLVDNFILTQGGTLVSSQDIKHPHAGA